MVSIYLQILHMQGTPLDPEPLYESSPEVRSILSRAAAHIIDNIANRFGYTLQQIDHTGSKIHTFGGPQAKHEQNSRAQLLSPDSDVGPKMSTRSSSELATPSWTWNSMRAAFSARLPSTRLTITNLTPLPFPGEITVAPTSAPSPELTTEPGIELPFFDTLQDASLEPSPSPVQHLQGNLFENIFPQIDWLKSPSPGAFPEPTMETEPSPDQRREGNPFEVTFPHIDWIRSPSPEAAPEPSMETLIEQSFEHPQEHSPEPSLEPQLAFAPFISVPLDSGPDEDYNSRSSISAWAHTLYRKFRAAIPL